jgi:hypothetical protein
MAYVEDSVHAQSRAERNEAVARQRFQHEQSR